MPFATLADRLLSITTAHDPAGAYVACTIVAVPATSSIAAHEALKSKCTLCGAFKTWSSWTRIRAHLSGDDAMALGAGTTKCTNVPSAVAERFKAMITVAHADARCVSSSACERNWSTFPRHDEGMRNRLCFDGWTTGHLPVTDALAETPFADTPLGAPSGVGDAE